MEMYNEAMNETTPKIVNGEIPISSKKILKKGIIDPRIKEPMFESVNRSNKNLNGTYPGMSISKQPTRILLASLEIKMGAITAA